MVQKAGIAIWLIFGVGFCLISFVCSGAGGYGVWYTHSEVQAAEKQDEDDEKELKKPVLPAQRHFELQARRQANVDRINDTRKHRQWALAFLVACSIPILAALRCFFTVAVRSLKKQQTEEPESEPEDEVKPAPPRSTGKTAKKPPRED